MKTDKDICEDRIYSPGSAGWKSIRPPKTQNTPSLQQPSVS